LQRLAATWRSGYAAACKAVYTGSIPVVALAFGAYDQLPAMVTTVLSIVTAGLGFAAIVGLVIVPLLGDRDRAREDAARAFFDRHGRWPDDASD
jgi:hypothetical protein